MTEQQIDEPEMTSSSSSETPAVENALPSEDAYFAEPDLEPGSGYESADAPETFRGRTYHHRVGDGDADRFFSDDPETKLDQIAAYCQNCPINHQCAEGDCAVWRSEQRAQAAIDGRTSIAGVVIPAEPGA